MQEYVFFFTVVRFREFKKKQCIKGQRESNGQLMSQKKLWEPTILCGIKQTKEEVVIIKHFTTAEPETQELVGTKNGAKREWEFKFASKQMMTLLYKIPCYTCWPPGFPGRLLIFISFLSFFLASQFPVFRTLLEMFAPLPPISAIVQHVVCSTVESCPPQPVREGQR